MTRTSGLGFPLELNLSVPPSFSSSFRGLVMFPEAAQRFSRPLVYWEKEQGEAKLFSVISQFIATCNQSSDEWGFTKNNWIRKVVIPSVNVMNKIQNESEQDRQGLSACLMFSDTHSSSTTQGCTIPEPHSWHPKPSVPTHFKLHVLRATFSQPLTLLVRSQLSFSLPHPTHPIRPEVLLPLPLPCAWAGPPSLTWTIVVVSALPPKTLLSTPAPPSALFSLLQPAPWTYPMNPILLFPAHHSNRWSHQTVSGLPNSTLHTHPPVSGLPLPSLASFLQWHSLLKSWIRWYFLDVCSNASPWATYPFSICS